MHQLATLPRLRPLIFKVAIPNTPLYQLFDYLAPDNHDYGDELLGCRVLVPFGTGNQCKVACVLAIALSSDYPNLKQVQQILDNQPLLNSQDLHFLRWLSRYYHHPIGDIISMALPTRLRQGKAAVNASAKAPERFIEHGAAPQSLVCNFQQQQAIESICLSLGQFQVFLLDGVTGSGKTEVYLQVVAQVLARHEQVLVLVPEIGLTPQLESRFRHRFQENISVSHSKLTDGQRLNAWLAMQTGEQRILLGTRSALFTPLPRAGLLILDEEHDSSFKQQDGLRFSARDAAIVRAKLLGIPIILGSATPSLESIYNAQQGRYQWLRLDKRVANATAPVMEIIDIRNKKMQQGLSQVLLEAITASLAQGEQVLLFLNRRGYAPTLLCHSCGWVARCPHCDANLVIHQKQQQLRCHHCEQRLPLPTSCPECQAPQLQPLGLGTERVEQTLARLYADKTIVRLDVDSMQTKNALSESLTKIALQQVDIILGTQLLAKGHHFPNVTLVALLNVDSGLFSVDFHAPEKLAQLIIQVAGRAGRAEKKGRVLLQTHHPQHGLLTTLMHANYNAFAVQALSERCAAGLPPFSYQALIRAQARSHELAQTFLAQVVDLATQLDNKGILILGPVPAPMLRRAAQCRYQLLLQHPQRSVLQTLLTALVPKIAQLKPVRKVRWSLDVDPLDLY